jgi:non-heme Fe2+,alpha-ketoglutarate-dependent halogenase
VDEGASEGIGRFGELGYAGPFRILPHDVALRLGERLALEVLSTDSPIYAHSPTDVAKLRYVRDRHLDSPLVYRLCVAAPIVDRIAALLGPDLLLWRSDFFVQSKDDRESLPHQD